MQTHNSTQHFFSILFHEENITMRLTISAIFLLVGSTFTAFAPPAQRCNRPNNNGFAVYSSPHIALAMSEAATMADSGKPPASTNSDMNIADAEIPTRLPTDVGMDYVPLATMLATGQLAEADQVRQWMIKGDSMRFLFKAAESTCFCLIGDIPCMSKDFTVETFVHISQTSKSSLRQNQP